MHVIRPGGRETPVVNYTSFYIFFFKMFGGFLHICPGLGSQLARKQTSSTSVCSVWKTTWYAEISRWCFSQCEDKHHHLLIASDHIAKIQRKGLFQRHTALFQIRLKVFSCLRTDDPNATGKCTQTHPYGVAGDRLQCSSHFFRKPDCGKLHKNPVVCCSHLASYSGRYRRGTVTHTPS